MKKIYLFLLILLLNQSVNFAQQEPDSSKISLKELVISANKVEEDKKTLAQQIETISAREIKNLNTQTTADLLQQSGHLFVQKSQMGGGSPVIRGFEASRVLLMIDGVRQNNLIYRAGHLQNIITFDQNMLSKLEITFGPSSTIYGSDALGGVISMYTKNPVLSATNQIKVDGNTYVRYSSANQEKTGHLDFNIGSKKFASLSSFTYSDFEDLRMGGTKNPYYKRGFGERTYYVQRINNKDSLVLNSNPLVQKFSGYQQYDILQKFLYQQNDQINHVINLQYSNSSNIPRYDRLTDPKNAKDPSNPNLNSAEWYYGPQERLLTAYNFVYNDTNKWINRLSVTASYQAVEESRNNRNFGSSNLNKRIESVDVAGLTVDLQHKKGQHDIRFGFDGQYNELVSRAKRLNINTGQEVALDTRYADGKNNQSNYALYISDSYNLNKKFYLHGGLRGALLHLYSSFIDTTFFPFPFNEVNQNNQTISGNLGIVYLPGKNLKISLMGSTGYRTPNIDDLSKVFSSQPGVIIVPNPNIKPEQTFNTDLQITGLIADKIRWENVFYYTNFSQAIVTDNFTFNGKDSVIYDGKLSAVFANQNKGKAYLYGVNSIMHANLIDFLSVYGSITYTYGRIKTDTTDYPLDHIPPAFGKAGIRFANNKFSADGFIIMNGWKGIKDYNLNGEDNQQYATDQGTPAWYTINIRISYLLFNKLQIQAGIDNIMDIQYRTFASGINAPGRNMSATLRYKF